MFAHDPEKGWKPEYTAADALDRLVEYLEMEGRGEFPRVEELPLTLRSIRLSIPPSLATELRRGGPWGMWSAQARKDLSLLRMKSVDGTSPSSIISSPVHAELDTRWVIALGLSQSVDGLWCRIDKAVEHVPTSRHEIEEWIRQQLPNAQARQLFQSLPLVLLVLNNGLRFVRKRMPGPLDGVPGGRLVYVEPVEEDIEERIFNRVEGRISRVVLRDAQVAVVGAGSLGSSIAVALAKAGVGKFVLFDPEQLTAENVARHVGGVGEIGLPKVAVVARAIHRVNPTAEVVEVPAALSLEPEGWGHDSTLRLLQVVRNTGGIVVCATATADAERMVNYLCVTHRCSAVFSAVLGRAEHGRVFRVIPGVTPCYQCVLLAQHADPGRFPRFDRVDMGVPAYRQPGLPGLGMDVDQVALIAARMTLQTLLERSGDADSYPKAHGDHLLWSNLGGWVVDGPLQARVEQVPREGSCPVCGEGSRQDLSPEEERELSILQQRLLGPS
ncbi:ThiF family adenylyltransferase [Myxococcus sp. MISCRS1]|uniref:ThiF family adenylyltransferase n=1 Tax=Myxococcus sp. MISCRS1 TaxID=2996786 RepID=UPI00226F878E|nr:ThiF family adenylyltransferase [Myxococcus sp. MISCRS1]MCY1003828.1 ThiF family adenylyltransferase [Myxococcus sp. MISCRS1]